MFLTFNITLTYIKNHIEDQTYWQERCSYVKPVINQFTKELGSSISYCDINDTKIGSFLENRWKDSYPEDVDDSG